MKALFRRFMRKQHRAAMEREEKKGVVIMAEIAGIVEKAVKESWDGTKAAAMNQEVGYFLDEAGRLAWDMHRQVAGHEAADPGAAAQRVRRRDVVMGQQQSQRSALAKARSEIAAARVAILKSEEVLIAAPKDPVPRSRLSISTGMAASLPAGCTVKSSLPPARPRR